MTDSNSYKMVSGKFKTKRFRKIFVKTPGAKLVIHRIERKINLPKCAICKTELKGMPRLINSEFKNLPKSKKTTNRPYGGNLCSRCMRAKLKQKAREM